VDQYVGQQEDISVQQHILVTYLYFTKRKTILLIA